jgi:hypothetical protein
MAFARSTNVGSRLIRRAISRWIISFAVSPTSDSLTLVLMSGRPSPIVKIGCPDGGWKLFHLLGLRANYK